MELEAQVCFIERTCQVEFYHVQNHATLTSCAVFRGGGVQVSVPPKQVVEAALESGCMDDYDRMTFIVRYGVELLRKEIEKSYS